jgi:type VI secretion system protein ImpF
MNAGDAPVLDSVLDRLLAPVGSGPPRPAGLAELRASVHRDLEALLNTRRRCRSWPAELGELDSSLLAYGVPDFTGTDLVTTAAQDAYCRVLERTIRRFEPRFVTVKVERLANLDALDSTLRFRISALMYAEPAPEPLVLDSALDPATRSIAVRSRHA